MPDTHYLWLQLTPAQMILPLIALMGTWGWRRGWQEEAWTGMLFLFALIIYSKTQTSLVKVLNIIVEALINLFNSLLTPNSATQVSDATNPVTISQQGANVLAILMLAVGVYLLGGSLGKRKGLKTWGHLLGVVFASLNASIIFSQLMDAWFAWGDHPGLLTTAHPLPRLDIPGRIQPVHINFDLSFPRWIIDSTLPPLPTQNVLTGWTIYGGIIFVVILVVVGIFRLPKISE